MPISPKGIVHWTNRFRAVWFVLGVLAGMGWCAAGYGQERISMGAAPPPPTSSPAPTLTPLAKEDLQALREKLQAAMNAYEMRNALSAIRRKGQAATELIPDLLVMLQEGWDVEEIVGVFTDLGPEGRAALLRLICGDGTKAARVTALARFPNVGGGPWSPEELRVILEAALDPDEKVSAVARRILPNESKLNRDAATVLLAWYRDNPGPEREELLAAGLPRALLHKREGTGMLIELQTDTNPTIRRIAREAFSKSQSSPAIEHKDAPLLFNILAGADEEFYFVARKLTIPGSLDRTKLLESMFHSKNERQRALAMRMESRAPTRCFSAPPS